MGLKQLLLQLFLLPLLSRPIQSVSDSCVPECLISGTTYRVDDQFITSDSSDGRFTPQQSRLGGMSWCSAVNPMSPWLQVDFEHDVTISTIQTGGYNRTRFNIFSNDYYVDSYEVHIGNSSEDLEPVLTPNTTDPMVFYRHRSPNVYNSELQYPITTQVLRIVPIAWTLDDYACLTLEALGCPAMSVTPNPQPTIITSINTSTNATSTNATSTNTTATTDPIDITETTDFTSMGDMSTTTGGVDAAEAAPQVIAIVGGAVGGVLVLVILLALLVIVMVCVVKRKRSESEETAVTITENDDSGAYHTFNNDIYGQDLDGASSPNYASLAHTNKPDSDPDTQEYAYADPQLTAVVRPNGGTIKDEDTGELAKEEDDPTQLQSSWGAVDNPLYG